MRLRERLGRIKRWAGRTWESPPPTYMTNDDAPADDFGRADSASVDGEWHEWPDAPERCPRCYPSDEERGEV